ncbi:uncharacterized protein LOC123192384 [Mangifera indica]|uniref:uncharacterized protein LOC123192384 n=1 Tax=Mangifera indica TaxID=29780 RepID=UPI001CFC1DA1|nr:uncharacterized protein LOC123192384 [Mangifera indica]XP_044460853.1 uncharacterized protein LOC123192384 [Mangifera indica]
MNWIQRKIYLYNVTFGLYMLDWWERYLFNILVIVLMWFIFYNSSRYVTEYFKGYDTIGLHSNMFSRASDSTTETVTNSLCLT